MKWKRLRKFFLVVFGSVSLVVMALNTIDIGVIRTGRLSAVYIGGWRRIPFDEKVWRIHEPIGWQVMPSWDNRRLRMVGDLVAHNLQDGMTKEKVESILGKPDGELDGRIQYYSLLQSHRWDQKLIAWMRFGTWNPSLLLIYDRKDLKLKRIQVGRSSRGPILLS